MKKKQAIKIFKWLEEWTRCVIMARHGEFGNSLEFGDYAASAREIEDKIREELYGKCDLIQLGLDWGLLKQRKKNRKHKHKETLLDIDAEIGMESEHGDWGDRN